MARKAVVALVCSLALSGSLGACSSESQPEAESAVCSSIASVKTAAAGVKALSSTSTVNEVEAATKALNTAITGLKENSADLKQADLAAVEAAGDEIQKAAAGVTGSDTLGEAATAIQTSTASLDTAVAEMANGVQCK